jgi:hypothetical protein
VQESKEQRMGEQDYTSRVFASYGAWHLYVSDFMLTVKFVWLVITERDVETVVVVFFFIIIIIFIRLGLYVYNIIFITLPRLKIQNNKDK